jgi:acyl-CoA thioester hydrolase
MTAIFEYPHTVADDEIDELGHANNVVYVGWFQAAALAHSASYGWNAQRYRALGMGWVARSHRIEYHRPAMAGDRIVVRTGVIGKKRVAYTRGYRIVRPSDGALLASGESVWAFVDYATGRPVRIPPEIADAFPGAANLDGEP